MRKFAVGTQDRHQEIKVTIVEAENELNAFIYAVNKAYGWELEEDECEYQTVDEGIEYFMEMDLNISRPVEINLQ